MENLNRREFFRLSACGFLALNAALPLFACETVHQGDKAALISWDDFVKKIQNLSEVSLQKDWHQQNYVETIEKLMLSLDINDQFIKKYEQNYRNAHKNFPEINAMHKEQKFMVSLLEFEPGEKIKLHDHPDMTGVIYCTQGKVAIQNYDLLATPSSNQKILLKQSGELVVTPGKSATLTAKARNIHALQAEKFTRLIDVFTPPYDADRIKRSKWFNVVNANYNSAEKICEVESL